jgi:ribonucleoside-diphosphate reductase alpha chain
MRATSVNEKLKKIVDQELKLAKNGVSYAGAYSTFKGSPLSEGLFQHDLWKLEGRNVTLSGRWDWDSLRTNVVCYGVRNSLGLCIQPTASTASISGNNECIEPFTSNIYNRTISAGTYQLINKHLIRDLYKAGLWTQENRLKLISDRGSVQNMNIPQDLKERYRTVWEMSNKDLISMSAERGRFICQTQSLNLFLAEATHEKLRKMHLDSWKQGLKTGIYYLRSKAASSAMQTISAPVHVPITQELNVPVKKEFTEEEKNVCRRDNPEACIACT